MTLKIFFPVVCISLDIQCFIVYLSSKNTNQNHEVMLIMLTPVTVRVVH